MIAAEKGATGHSTPGEATTTADVGKGGMAPGDLWHLINYTFGLRLTVVLFILGLIIGADLWVGGAPRGSPEEAIATTIFEIAAVLLAGAGSAATVARTLAVRPDIVNALVAEHEIDCAITLHRKIRKHLPWSGAAQLNYWFARLTRWYILLPAIVGLLFANRLLIPILWYPLEWIYSLFDSFYEWLFESLGIPPT